ncbi:MULTISPECIES: site-2 protease family protein [Streptomyces]|uniref:Putative zinc metalloproteasec/MT2700 n=1 Tax=Streptomyces chartreusis NRRL 3882 TaxID=1079985 RepID=A0A2N9BI05_STRCX|nr:site-2 protease family protein [Streptomyces chartreusis]MYS93372.1 peptidase [Streptomyces sp. SID5464]SOR82992.1 putative zinc metalloproteasec/MT2700 [Streptomyces chartreusis NRRL 3882]
MDESGGRGQPRSGNEESAERHAGSPARATDPTPADEQSTDVRRFTSTSDDDAPAAPPPARPEDRPSPQTPEPAADPAAAEAPDAAPGDPEPGQDPAAATTDGPPDRQPTQASPQGHPDRPEASAHGEDDGSGRPEGDAHADRPEPDALRKAPARGDHDGGSRPSGADAHPDRAYATGPHTGSAAGKPDAHGRHVAPGTGDRPLAHSADGKGPAPQRPEPRGGLLMGRPFGVPVYVAPSWFLVAALITWVFGGQLERVLPELGAARYLVSLFFAVAFYASVLVHELAHTVAALRFKLPVRRIQLQFFGGVSEIEKEAETPGREFVLAFVGPLLSLVLAGVFYAAMQTVEPGTVPGVLLAGLMISNLIVAAFNLLPGLPLDGGRMLRAVVWKITGKPMSGTVAAAWVGRALAVSVLIGLPLLTQSGALGTDAVDNVGMDTVLDALLAAILAAIIWTGAGNSLRMARLREHLPELRARALTRRAVPVETDTPLSEALRRANAAGARALVVVDAHGNPVSLVREAAIVGVPEHRRPWVAVSGLAQDLTDGMRVSAELSGEELLDALRATPATEYLVVEETGEIYGVLSAADVERAFVKAMARPS